jgi:hypothetical protein
MLHTSKLAGCGSCMCMLQHVINLPDTELCKNQGAGNESATAYMEAGVDMMLLTKQQGDLQHSLPAATAAAAQWAPPHYISTTGAWPYMPGGSSEHCVPGLGCTNWAPAAVPVQHNNGHLGCIS